MRPAIFFLLLLFSFHHANAQFRLNASSSLDENETAYTGMSYEQKSQVRKLYQHNRGIILGYQRGVSNLIELGGEAHWRKMSLRKPRITGANINMEYDFINHVVGYKAGMWMKQGRINFTYGANLAYFTDFKGNHRYGINPAIGFRLAGFHLINGYNITTGDAELDEINTLYLSLRYYFPLENKFTWDRKTQRKIKQKRKEKEERREERRNRRNNGKEKEEEPKGLWNKVKEKFKKS
jgi:hypothetical protein